jgi:hypothetical protein
MRILIASKYVGMYKGEIIFMASILIAYNYFYVRRILINSETG